MRKIQLNVEALQVETFTPEAESSPVKGTVRGREFTLAYECPSVESGYQGCPGCQNGSGNSSCVWCYAPNSGTCQDCSWTYGDGNACYW